MITHVVVCELIGLLYIELSKKKDHSISYINGWLDTIYLYENSFKSTLIFKKQVDEIPLKHKLQSLKIKEYDSNIIGKDAEYNKGAIDANNFIVYYINTK